MLELDQKMLKQIVDFVEDKKGGDISLLNLRDISMVTDYCLIVTGNTTTQVKAIANYLEVQLPEMGVPIFHLEGLPSAQWILMDCGGDLVVHVMTPEQREFYQLERLWKDAGVVSFDPAQV